MQSEFDAVEGQELEAVEESRDRTKLVWLAVIAVFAVMIGVLYVTQKPTDMISTVRAKHILIKADMGDPSERQQALTRAKELRQRLVEGADFERMAREYSNDPFSSQRGGDLGYSTRDNYETSFEKYIWAAPLNEISDIISTSRGYHIIVVTDRRFSAADRYEHELQKQEKGEAAQEKTGAEKAPAQ